MPLVRICGGGGQRWSSLLQLPLSISFWACMGRRLAWTPDGTWL